MRHNVVLYFFLLSLTSILPCHAQQIENIRYDLQENILSVNYDLINCPLNEVYTIRLRIQKDSSDFMDAQYLEGDYKNVMPGKNKSIIWHDTKDLKTNPRILKVVLVISKVHPINNLRVNLLLSALLPGLGDRNLQTKNKSWPVISAAYIGLAGTACALKINSNHFYDLYHSTTTQSDMDDYFNKANRRFQLFQFCATAAAAIWLADITYVGIRTCQNKHQTQTLSASAFKKPHFYFAVIPNYFQAGLIKKF